MIEIGPNLMQAIGFVAVAVAASFCFYYLFR